MKHTFCGRPFTRSWACWTRACNASKPRWQSCWRRPRFRGPAAWLSPLKQMPCPLATGPMAVAVAVGVSYFLDCPSSKTSSWTYLWEDQLSGKQKVGAQFLANPLTSAVCFPEPLRSRFDVPIRSHFLLHVPYSFVDVHMRLKWSWLVLGTYQPE